MGLCGQSCGSQRVATSGLRVRGHCVHFRRVERLQTQSSQGCVIGVASCDWARSCRCHFVQGPAKGGKALLDAFAQYSESVQADGVSSSGFPTVTNNSRVAHPRPCRARGEVWLGRLLRSVERQESPVDLCEVELGFQNVPARMGAREGVELPEEGLTLTPRRNPRNH